MAGNPQIVTENVTFTWDGVSQRLARGQVLDVPPGSALLAAIGPQNLTPMFRAGSTALPPEPPEQVIPGAAEDVPAQDETPAPKAKPAQAAPKGAADAKDSGT